MGSVTTTLEFLDRLPIYETEAAFQVFPSPNQPGDDPTKLSNIKLRHGEVTILDLREQRGLFSIETTGFEVVHDHYNNLEFNNQEALTKYAQDTEELLYSRLSPVFVKCWDQKLRHSGDYASKVVDVNDPMLVQTLPRGVHVDSTFESSQWVIEGILSNEERALYLNPGHRVRIVNTWRPLIPIVEDRPLAMCDFRTISGDDLVATDRIFPDKRQQNYLLHQHENQQFFYLSHQTPDELIMMVMFDTQAGDNARYCPHASFSDPRVSADVPIRRSIETRSIVITKVVS